MKAFLSSILSFSPLIPAGGVVSAAGAARGSRPSTLARASTTQQPADGGWPRAYITTSGARLVIYEPQIASRLDQKRMAMYAAVSYTPADESSTAPSYDWGAGFSPVYDLHDSRVRHGARYDPWTGASTRAGAASGPYGEAGDAARYNPRTGMHARGATAWGPGGARGTAQAWHLRLGTSVDRAAVPISQLTRHLGARLDGAQQTRNLGSINSGHDGFGGGRR
jgi:hypothetical protein